MRLISFLTDLERALIAESPMVDGGAWVTSRMVNFHQGLGRLTLVPRSGVDLPHSGGALFVQSFVLADGSQCIKASLNWKGSDALPTMAVYSTPTTNWKLEASRIASAWLEGPPALATITEVGTESTAGFPPLAASAG